MSDPATVKSMLEYLVYAALLEPHAAVRWLAEKAAENQRQLDLANARIDDLEQAQVYRDGEWSMQLGRFHTSTSTSDDLLASTVTALQKEWDADAEMRAQIAERLHIAPVNDPPRFAAAVCKEIDELCVELEMGRRKLAARQAAEATATPAH